MRRYTLDVSNREFVIDVQELAADRFEVIVGDESYEVTLSGDENLGEAVIAPGLSTGLAETRVVTKTKAARPVREAPAAASAPAAPKRQPGAAGKGALTAPMPGVILEVSVKAGDQVERGQQIAILDAMKMHNVIGAPRAGTIAEVFVEAGQNVDHGAAIVSFKED